MDGPIDKAGECFYIDAAAKMYFCVSEFVHRNQLPDSPKLRLAVIEAVVPRQNNDLP